MQVLCLNFKKKSPLSEADSCNDGVTNCNPEVEPGVQRHMYCRHNVLAHPGRRGLKESTQLRLLVGWRPTY